MYENGVFHTPSATTAPPSAVLVRGETIEHTGSAAACRDRAGRPHRTVDLDGAHVVAGFTDSHIHTAQLALQSAEVDLSAARSLDATLALVSARVVAGQATDPCGTEWIFGGRWNNRLWPDRTTPTRFQLDAVTGDVPVALHHADLHTYWVNSAGLARMGIDATSTDPIGGCYARDAEGQLTGILGEAAAFAAERFFAPLTSTALDHTLETTLQRLLSNGVTSIHDIDGDDALRAFTALQSAGKLPLRVHKLMPVASLDSLIERGIRSGDGDDWLRFGAVKIFGDGSLSSHTCLLHEAYPGQPDNTGIAVTPPALLEELVQKLTHNGLAAAVHAIGDAAVTNAIAALERLHTGSRSALPNRIEHVQHIALADLDRLGALGVVACMQPSSCTSDIDMVNELLGDRQIGSYAWRSILDAGSTLAFSSDAPVESINPFTGIHAAVTRQRPNGYPRDGWQPEQRVSRREAFAAYTTGPAIASGESATKGLLAPGYLADFAVLDRDPFVVDDDSLLHTNVLLTVVGGDVRWEG